MKRVPGIVDTNSNRVVIREAESEHHLDSIRALFREYAATLGTHICVQDLEEQELPSLPGRYARPNGRLLLAIVDGEPAGCIALKPRLLGVGEVKRLYVRSQFRGRGIGKLLLEHLIHEARAARYSKLALDTLPSMESARRLYGNAGFEVVRERGPEEPLDMEFTLGDGR